MATIKEKLASAESIIKELNSKIEDLENKLSKCSDKQKKVKKEVKIIEGIWCVITESGNIIKCKSLQEAKSKL